ncbi:hypothetical protein VPIG_00162 [Vibrio phage PWH3a-P1]|uniref:hypothetical protein n=1 Tax=Vibrio phage PWH3a-P1 TaxID=754058 RepID=UPI0002C10A20|nr:hypothetical protein VPIG_00162 [Vibrio phage PWH3a-P1]AGH32019.1 hypothetical protein VPIG_00162 [Vibrio phage PWH3a-P1]
MADDTKSTEDVDVSPPSNTTREQRASKRRISTSGIQMIKDQIEYLKPFELSAGQRLITYERMLLDPDVSTPFNKTKEMVEQAFSSYNIEYNKNSPESKKARDFMMYCIESYFNSTTTPRSVASHAFTYTKNKLAIFEKEYSKIADGEWKDFWGLDGLYPIHLSTLDLTNPFKIEDGGRRLSHLRQSRNAFKNNLNSSIKDYPDTKDGYVDIPRNKLALFTDSVDSINPFGISIFDHIYEEWRFKTLVKDILLTGVAKDLAGTPVFFVPSILMEEAEADPTSWQADFLRNLDEQAANMHTGDQTFIRLPSDPHEGSSSMREFDLKFLGVEGSSKAFDLVEILEQSKKAIYNAFGAQNLLTGEQGGGSYNLIEGQNSNHAFTVKRNVTIIEEVWNKDIWPQLFRLNEWKLSPEDIPKFRAGDVEPISLDELGKYMQRVISVGVFPIVPATVNWYLQQSRIPYQFPDDATTEDILSVMPTMTSNASKGDGTSGTGNSQINGDGNTENTA